MPGGSVFICHASANISVATQLVAELEARGLTCWISSRDVPPGTNFQEAIVRAIHAARAIVFLFSEASNQSGEVLKELALASAQRLPVLPVRLDNATPGAALRYELATRQWVDCTNAGDAAARLLAVLRPLAAAAEPVLALPDKPSIAVLPFANLGSGPDQEFFADGITEDITVELSRFPVLFVISHNSSITYRGRTVDRRQVARELGVRYVLEGSVRVAAGRVRITGQLTDCLTGSQLWAERYDRGLEDVLAVQDEVTRGIVAAVAPQVELAAAELARRTPPLGGAQALTWRAQGLMDEGVHAGRPDLVLDAIAAAERAIAEDPAALAAHGVLAWAHWSCHLYRWGPAPDAALAGMEAAVSRMAALSPLDHRTLAASGILRAVRGEHARAIADLRRALEMNPNASRTMMWLAFCQAASGAAAAAREHAQMSIRLNPRDHWIGVAQLALAMAAFCDGDDAEAMRWAELSIQSEPAAPLRRVLLVACCAAAGQPERAAAQRAELERLAPGFLARLRAGEVVLFHHPEAQARVLRALGPA